MNNQTFIIIFVWSSLNWRPILLGDNWYFSRYSLYSEIRIQVNKWNKNINVFYMTSKFIFLFLILTYLIYSSNKICYHQSIINQLAKYIQTFWN
jgi:hypothetical protein